MHNVIKALEVMNLAIDYRDTSSLCRESLGHAAHKGLTVMTVYYVLYIENYLVISMKITFYNNIN